MSKKTHELRVAGMIHKLTEDEVCAFKDMGDYQPAILEFEIPRAEVKWKAQDDLNGYSTAVISVTETTQSAISAHSRVQSPTRLIIRLTENGKAWADARVYNMQKVEEPDPKDYEDSEEGCRRFPVYLVGLQVFADKVIPT